MVRQRYAQVRGDGERTMRRADRVSELTNELSVIPQRDLHRLLRAHGERADRHLVNHASASKVARSALQPCTSFERARGARRRRTASLAKEKVSQSLGPRQPQARTLLLRQRRFLPLARLSLGLR